MQRGKNLSNFENGLQYYQKKEYQKAVAQFTLAIQNRDRIGFSLVQRARAYSRLNQLDNALNDCNRAIQFDSIREEAYYVRARVYIDRAKYQDALNDFDQVGLFIINISERHAFVFYSNRSMAFEGIGNFIDAIADLEMALTYFIDINIYWQLSFLYLKVGDKSQALYYFLNALLIDLKKEGSVTDEIVKKYKAHLSYYQAEDILDSLRTLSSDEIKDLIDHKENKIKLIKKYDHDDSQVAHLCLKIGTKFQLDPQLACRAIEVLLKGILIEIKMGKAFDSEIIKEIFDVLINYDALNILGVVDQLDPDDALMLLEQCVDRKTILSQSCTENEIDEMEHEYNYKRFMRQPESVRLSSRGLSVLFPTDGQDKSENKNSNDWQASVSSSLR